MRTAFDFTPYRSSSIGFDRVFDLLESTARADQAEGYPRYNVEQRDEDSYQISIAVADFSRDEIEITSKPNLLVVSGEKKEENSGGRYLHRGISARRFERQFHLADYVTVTGASLRDGLLAIDLKRELPEAVKPRKIEIGDSAIVTPRLVGDTDERQAA